MRSARSFTALFVAVVLTACQSPEEKSGQIPVLGKPNILIIVPDDLRVHRDFNQMMPRVWDWFRDGGTIFTNAVVATPLCCPSRAQIFSGRFGHNNHVQRFSDYGDLNLQKTMQYALDQAGYKMGLFGKYIGSRGAPSPKLFDRWAVFDPEKAYTGVTFNVNGEQRVVDEYSTTFIRDQALAFLDEFKGQEPWYLHVAPYAPHGPAEPAPGDEGAPVPGFATNPATEEGSLADKPPVVRKLAEKTSRKFVVNFRRKQLRTMIAFDDLFAQVIDVLEQNGEDNTLVILISDNGYMHFEHGIQGKNLPYDPSVEVPLFMKWIGKPSTTPRDPRIAANIDVAPTVFDATDITPGYTMDGHSLLGDHKRKHMYLEYWSLFEFPSWRALWHPRWMYVKYEDGFREYYGRDDPYQLLNLYGNPRQGDEPANEAELERLMRRYRDCEGTACP